MTYTHSQAQRDYDNMEPNEGQGEDMDYVRETAREVVEGYYKNLWMELEIYELWDHIDLEDWLNEKTHFKYVDKQWESNTLELLSEGGE